MVMKSSDSNPMITIHYKSKKQQSTFKKFNQVQPRYTVCCPHHMWGEQTVFCCTNTDIMEFTNADSKINVTEERFMGNV